MGRSSFFASTTPKRWRRWWQLLVILRTGRRRDPHISAGEGERLCNFNTTECNLTHTSLAKMTHAASPSRLLLSLQVRLVHQAGEERNYHIFYELLAAAARSHADEDVSTRRGDDGDGTDNERAAIDDARTATDALPSAEGCVFLMGGNCLERRDGVSDGAMSRWHTACQVSPRLYFWAGSALACWGRVVCDQSACASWWACHTFVVSCDLLKYS